MTNDNLDVFKNAVYVDEPIEKPKKDQVKNLQTYNELMQLIDDYANANWAEGSEQSEYNTKKVIETRESVISAISALVDSIPKDCSI